MNFMNAFLNLTFIEQFMAQHQSFTPIVNPIGEMPSQPTKPGQTFTKTSLAANKQVNDTFCNFIVWFCLYI